MSWRLAALWTSALLVALAIGFAWGWTWRPRTPIEQCIARLEAAYPQERRATIELFCGAGVAPRP